MNHISVKLGTGLSILISKRNPSLVTTFTLLSCGYVLSSYKEVRLCAGVKINFVRMFSFYIFLTGVILFPRLNL